MPAQLLSLILSVLFFIASIYLAFYGRREGTIFYIGQALTWSAGIFYYFFIIFLGGFDGAHEMSSLIRLIQYCGFGGWIILSACERFLQSCKSCDTFKNAIGRVTELWKQRS